MGPDDHDGLRPASDQLGQDRTDREAPAAGQSILTTTRKHRGADAYREVAGNLMAKQKAGSAS